MAERSRASLQDRVSDLELSAQKMVDRVLDFEGLLERLTGHVEDLKDWRQERAIQEAKREERSKALENRLDSIEASIKEISTGIKRVVWAIGMAIILAVMQFILTGGLDLLGKG